MKLNTTFNRVYQFTCAHRLHSDTLSDRENLDVYDKCNNYNGHGHDYTLEVSLKGDPDPKTGMIVPLQEFDHRVKKVLSVLDYKHLDKEVEYFRTHHSSGEVIVQYLWDELEKLFPHGQLYHLKLWETNNNYFELGV